MSYLIEKDGERQHVKDLDGFEDWTVLGSGAACKPRPHSNWDQVSGKWVLDPTAKAKAEHDARDPKELIAALEARVAALEALEAQRSK